jgi:N-acetyl-gamma-glutamyl-phosphate reductase common form
MNDVKRVGLVGARGHVGAELVRLIVDHPMFELAFVSSRALAGKPLSELVAEADGPPFEDLDAEAVARRPVDAVVLALPNDLSAPYVAAIDRARPDRLIVDLSADHRFDARWAYGLPEHYRDVIRRSRRVANPGCYATAAQLALAPIAAELSSPPALFAVSGYSGAGTTPSGRNDPERLRDNLVPYALVGHVHEREIARHLGREVHLMPHVASFFRGISITVDCALAASTSRDALLDRYRSHYDGERLVRIVEETPCVRDAAGTHGATVGGFEAVNRRAVMVATLDNLLKGAATQALQNLNLALGLDEHCGVPQA